MKITIGRKLITGFVIILSLMVTISIVSCWSLIQVRKSNEVVISLLHKMAEADHLQCTLLDALKLNDFIISGDLEKVGYFELSNATVAEAVEEVEGLDLDEEERSAFNKVKNEFRLVKEKSDLLLKQIKLTEKGFLDPEINKLVEDIDVSALAIVENSEFLHDHLNKKLLETRQKAERVKRFAGQTIVIISIVSILFGLITSLLLTRNITKPVNHLVAVTKEMARGDLTTKLKVTAQDEIGELAVSFNRMTVKLKEYYATLEQKVMERTKSLQKEINKRKQTEDALRKSKKWFSTTIKSIGDAVIATDIEGYVTFINPVAQALTGWSQKEAKGKPLEDIFDIVNEETGKKVENPVKKVVREGVVVGLANHTVLIAKDGTKIAIDDSAAPIKDEEGKIIGAVLVFRDITEKRELEYKLLQSEKLKSLGELAGGVAHNFNNTLTTILGRSQLLKMKFEHPPKKREANKSNAELRKGLEVIERAAKDGAETVKRLQEYVKGKTNQRHFTAVDVNEIIYDSLEFTKIRWKDDAESKGIKINIQKDFASLPPAIGSAAELREVFTNIINNALEAMPQGGTIKIKTFKENSHLIAQVIDTGSGVSKAIKDRIFDPFFTTKGPRYTGLGLSASLGIMKSHQGSMKVNSVEGQGTTFIIKLPISEKARERAKTEMIPKEQRKAKILIIDDEENVKNLLSDIINSGGHEVETAPDGIKGVELFKEKEFDLVLTDLGMPGMSGWQVAERIKSINERVPVALITGWDVELKESELRENWIDLVIHKPFEVNLVLELVQEGMMLRDRFKMV